MSEIESSINLSGDKNVEYCISLLKEINTDSAGKGKLLHKFKRGLNNLDNKQLIAVADNLSKFIHNAKDGEHLFESLLDDVLEMIEGNVN